MLSFLQDAWRYRKSPVVLDRRYDGAFLCLWALYGAWGISSAVVNTQYLNVPVGWYPTLWGTGIGIFAMVACCTILASFFTAADRFKERIRQKKIEAIAVAGMGGLIAVYPFLQLLRLITEYPPRPDSLFLGLSYMVMVIYRVSSQLRRAKELGVVDQRYQDGQRPS